MKKIGFMIKDINIESKTSIDIVFMIDLTGSMGYYINQAKLNLYNIVNRIMSECPAITINIGLVGYRDITEYLNGFYTNIDLTNNYTYLESVINSLYPSGGGDLPEDVAGALEMTLHKSWKNNARFAILIGDAPCHGTFCHNGFLDNYPNGVPGQRNITEIVKDLAENNISLFIMRITTDADKMLYMFLDIYKNYNNVEFHVDNMNSANQAFANIVVEAAKRVYINQRNNES